MTILIAHKLILSVALMGKLYLAYLCFNPSVGSSFYGQDQGNYGEMLGYFLGGVTIVLCFCTLLAIIKPIKYRLYTQLIILIHLAFFCVDLGLVFSQININSNLYRQTAYDFLIVVSLGATSRSLINEPQH